MSTTTNSFISYGVVSVNDIGPKKKGDKKKAEPAPTTVKPSTPVPPPIPPTSTELKMLKYIQGK